MIQQQIQRGPALPERYRGGYCFGSSRLGRENTKKLVEVLNGAVYESLREGPVETTQTVVLGNGVAQCGLRFRGDSSIEAQQTTLRILKDMLDRAKKASKTKKVITAKKASPPDPVEKLIKSIPSLVEDITLNNIEDPAPNVA